MQGFSYRGLRGVTPRVFQLWQDRLVASPLRARLAGGVFWSTAGALVSRALALVASIITARILGKVGFGEFGMIQSTAGMFATFAGFSMGLSATKHVAEYRAKDPARAGRVIWISTTVSWLGGLALAGGLALLAPWLATHALGAPHLSGALQLGALFLLFSAINDTQLGTLSGFEAFKRRAIVQLFGGLAAFPPLIAGVYFFGLTGAVCGLILSQAILVILTEIGIRRAAGEAGVPISWRGARREIDLLWAFNVPTILGSWVYVPAMWLANALVVNSANGYAEMGVFNAADRWRTAVMFLPTMLGGVILPVLSSLRAEKDHAKYYKSLWMTVSLSLLLSLAAASPIALLAPWIMGWYGAEFTDGTSVLVGLCGLSVMTSAFWIIGQSIVSEGRMWFLLVLNGAWSMILLISVWCLRDYGAKGLVFSYILADAVRLITVLIDLHSRRKRISLASEALPP